MKEYKQREREKERERERETTERTRVREGVLERYVSKESRGEIWKWD